MNLPPLYKCVLAIMLSVMLVGGLAYLFVWISKDVERARFALKEKESIIAAIESDHKRSLATEDLLEAHAGDIARMKGFIVNRRAPVRFIERLEDLARMTKNSISLLAEEGRNNEDTLFFRITFDGTETSVRNILRIIDAMPYDIAIESVSYENGSSTDADRGAKLIVSLKATAF